MNGKIGVAILLMLACLAMLVAGCSSPEEKAARAQLEQALALEKQHDLPAARELLSGLVKKYPQSKAATEALQSQQRILKQMDGLQRELGKALESMVLVIVGYQSMTGKPLRSLSDLDNGETMFDSSYLAEAIPEGIEAYVLFEDSGRFHFWVYRQEYRMGMQRESAKRGATPFSGDDELATLRSHYASESVTANLIELKPLKTAAQQ